MVQFAAVFQSVLVAPFQVAVVSIKVTVGPLTTGGPGSVVVILLKLLPETVPCVLICLARGGVFTVTEYLIVMLLVAGKVPMLTLTSSPDCGVRSWSFRGMSTLAALRFGVPPLGGEDVPISIPPEGGTPN